MSCTKGKNSLDIIQNTVNPKEVTCKGGIQAAERGYRQTPFEPVVMLGTDDNYFVKENDTYSKIDLEKSVNKTNAQVKKFVNYLFNELLQTKVTVDVVKESLLQILNIEQQSLEIAKEVCERDDDFRNFTRNGITDKIESIGNADEIQIEETFFFYPISSLLNVISQEINKNSKL
jgi:hypothetical protein